MCLDGPRGVDVHNDVYQKFLLVTFNFYVCVYSASLFVAVLPGGSIHDILAKLHICCVECTSFNCWLITVHRPNCTARAPPPLLCPSVGNKYEREDQR
jgi:hypothetical protein